MSTYFQFIYRLLSELKDSTTSLEQLIAELELRNETEKKLSKEN